MLFGAAGILERSVGMEANQKTGSSTIIQKLGKSVEYFEVIVLSASVFALATLVIAKRFFSNFLQKYLLC